MKRKALHGLFDDIVQVGLDGKKAAAGSAGCSVQNGMENWQLGFLCLIFPRMKHDGKHGVPRFLSLS